MSEKVYLARLLQVPKGLTMGKGHGLYARYSGQKLESRVMPIYDIARAFGFPFAHTSKWFAAEEVNAYPVEELFVDRLQRQE